MRNQLRGLTGIGTMAAVAVIVTSMLIVARIAAQAPAAAQASAPPRLAFEVASVKPNKSGSNFVQIGMQPGGRYTATNITVRQLVTNAYRLQGFQLTGGPAWLGSDHFDIVAKVPAELVDTLTVPPQGQGVGPIGLMLQALLADRFKLVVHNESRELPIYALVAARSDGKLGPQIHPTTTDCAALAAARGARGATPPPLPAPGERPPCGMMLGPGRLSAGSTTLTQLANSLSSQVQRTVLDRTEITGNYDVDLAWTPDNMPQRPAGATEPLRINGFEIDPNGPSIFTALQEQLGLKLDSTKGPVDVLVIDGVEQPTED